MMMIGIMGLLSPVVRECVMLCYKEYLHEGEQSVGLIQHTSTYGQCRKARGVWPNLLHRLVFTF